MAVKISKAMVKDVTRLCFIAKATFRLAGPVDSCTADTENYIAENLNESAFQKLTESDEVFIACAQSDSKTIGFIVVEYHSRCPNREDLKNTAKLQRLYVLPEYHGNNSAKLLLLNAIEECLNREIESIWLSVYSENNRAKKFYAKFGFQEIGTTYFQMGNEKHLDSIMLANIANKSFSRA